MHFYLYDFLSYKQRKSVVDDIVDMNIECVDNMQFRHITGS